MQASDYNECRCLCSTDCVNDCDLSQPVTNSDSLSCMVQKLLKGEGQTSNVELIYTSNTDNCDGDLLNVQQEDLSRVVEEKTTDVLNQIRTGDNCGCSESINGGPFQVTACFDTSDGTPCSQSYCESQGYCIPPEGEASYQCSARTMDPAFCPVNNRPALVSNSDFDLIWLGLIIPLVVGLIIGMVFLILWVLNKGPFKKAPVAKLNQ